MTHQQFVNAVENCVESETATDEGDCTCPVCALSRGDKGRNARWRRYSNDSFAVRCVKRDCSVPDMLALWGLDLNALRGTDGKLPPHDPNWSRTPRRYDSRNSLRGMEEH